MLGMIGALDVYVPEGGAADMLVLALFAHVRPSGNGSAAGSGAIDRPRDVVELFAGFDAWPAC